MTNFGLDRRVVLAGLSAMAVVPSSACSSDSPLLRGPVYRVGWGTDWRAVTLADWQVIRPFLLSRWHYDEIEDKIPVFRHRETGVTFLAVETEAARNYGHDWLRPLALREIDSTPGQRLAASADVPENRPIALAAASMMGLVGRETLLVRRTLKSAAYWDATDYKPGRRAPRILI